MPYVALTDPGRKPALPEQRRVRVADHRWRRELRPGAARTRPSRRRRRWRDACRAAPRGHAEQVEQSIVPRQRPQVEQLRARRVGQVASRARRRRSGSRGASCRSCPGTARRARRAGRPSGIRSSSQRILVAEKSGSSVRPVRSRTSSSAPSRAESLAAIGRPAALPDDHRAERVVRWRAPIPRPTRAGW